MTVSYSRVLSSLKTVRLNVSSLEDLDFFFRFLGGHQDVMNQAEKLQGCPVAGPWSAALNHRTKEE
jgi:hypothetical protein